jgi:hypothetical protein
MPQQTTECRPLLFNKRQKLLGQTSDLTEERVSRRKPQRNTGTDNERSIDQTSEQEHFGLQFAHEFWLTRSRLEVFGAHDADTDTSAYGTETDNETCSEGDKANDFHDDS